MRLFCRGHPVRHAVQVQALLAQRFTVVRHIDQRGGALQGLQPAHRLGQQVVGIAQRVVVGVLELFRWAFLQRIAGAFGLEEFHGGRRALVVRRAVAAHLVHDHHGAPGAALGVEPGQFIGQGAQHGFVEAFAVRANVGQIQVACIGMGNAVAYAFAARLVVEPQHGQPGTLQHIEQVFLVGVAPVKGLSPLGRKHAGHRGLGVGAARTDVGEIHQIALGLQLLEQGRGVARVSTQAKVGCARGLAHYQNDEG